MKKRRDDRKKAARGELLITGQRMTFKRAMKKYWVLYLMVLPAMVWYIVFKYIPMPTGLIISMEDYVPWKGLWKSNWVWFENYIRILTGGALPKVPVSGLCVPRVDRSGTADQ